MLKVKLRKKYFKLYTLLIEKQKSFRKIFEKILNSQYLI